MDSENKKEGSAGQDRFFYEFKEKMTVDPLEDSVKHVKKKASKKQTVTISVLVGLAVAAGIGWNVYGVYQGKNASVSEIPLLKADAEPEKVRPADPGGMEIADMDKLVYGRIAASGAESSEGYERILPAEEKPVSPEISAPDSLRASDDKIGAMIEELEEEETTVTEAKVAAPAKSEATTAKVQVAEVKDTVPPAPAPKPTPAPAPQETSPAVSEGVVTPAPAPTPAPVVKDVQKTTSVTAVKEADGNTVIVKEEEVKITAEVPVTKASAPAAAPAVDAFRVQILSGKDKKSVEAAGERLFAKYPEILKGYAYEVVEATVPDKGTFYRLRVKSFATREEAQSICKALKEKGQDCLVSSK